MYTSVMNNEKYLTHTYLHFFVHTSFSRVNNQYQEVIMAVHRARVCVSVYVCVCARCVGVRECVRVSASDNQDTRHLPDNGHRERAYPRAKEQSGNCGQKGTNDRRRPMVTATKTIVTVTRHRRVTNPRQGERGCFRTTLT